MLYSNQRLKDTKPDQIAVMFVDDMLRVAGYSNASDIHIEPFKESFRVRMRLDGMLKNMGEYDTQFHAPIITRAKLLANLNIAEKRSPQDGALVFEYKNRDNMPSEAHFRVSVIPTIYGEKMVLRRLSDKFDITNINNLGMNKEMLKRWLELISTPHGIILLSGPTGSGKSTTLFSTLQILNSESHNITTIEDPVEYKIHGINQTQINSIKISFADALRSVLRQDPDIIMVGEIRDKETAEIALRASLTGHKVFSTVHTNDSISSITRLIDMGIEPFLVSASVNGVLAQRLIRLLCKKCAKHKSTTGAEMEYLGLNEQTTIYEKCGCSECNYTGYSGRTAIYELFVPDEGVRHLISEGKSESFIKGYARETLDMGTLFLNAKERVCEGVTSIEEIQRVLGSVALD